MASCDVIVHKTTMSYSLVSQIGNKSDSLGLLTAPGKLERDLWGRPKPFFWSVVFSYDLKGYLKGRMCKFAMTPN